MATEKDMTIKQLKDTIKDLTSKLKVQNSEEKSLTFTDDVVGLVKGKDGIFRLVVGEVDLENRAMRVKEIREIGKNYNESEYVHNKYVFDNIIMKIE